MPDVVVAGSGIAGITAALHAADAGARVTLVTKDAASCANTACAQGGIAAAMFADDRPQAHAHDTLVAGAGLCDADAVRVLTAEGPGRVRELVAAGVAFDRTADGRFVKGLEAAHSYPRILHAGGDATGRAIETALLAQLAASTVTVVAHAFLTDVATVDGRAVGACLLVSGRRRVIGADAVILATGGAGQLFRRTTNPAVATGDGIAAALRAGAAVADLEFVQFHPTVLAQGPAFLVSEAVRGEGAVIRDGDGRRFLLDAHPDAELAPRDVVARAIAARMAGQGDRPVLLDATGMHSADLATRAAFLARRFPTIDAAVRAAGLDWAREPVPVALAAHYLMGGVATDLDGRTSLPGLYAAGEVARTGVHGANRLASNSLLEGAVFGARAGRAAARDAVSRPRGHRPVRQPAASAPVGARPAASSGTGPAGRRAAGAPAGGTPTPPFHRGALQRVMWECAGVIRSGAGLARAAAVLDTWAAAPRTPRTVRQHEDENLLLVARAVVAAASARSRSVGAHTRVDEPRPDTDAATAAPVALATAF